MSTTSVSRWDTFAQIISGLDESITVLHVPGNHDVVLGDNGVDSTPFTSRYGDDRFCRLENGVRIVGINTNLIKYGDSLEAGQKDWLKEVLKKDSPDEVTLVFGHHHSTHAGEYKGVTMKTLTAVGVQLGPDKSAFRVITVENGAVSDEIVELK